MILQSQTGRTAPVKARAPRKSITLDDVLAEPFRYPRIAAMYESRVGASLKRQAPGKKLPPSPVEVRSEKFRARQRRSHIKMAARQALVFRTICLEPITARDLAKVIGASDDTIRRDLMHLRREGRAGFSMTRSATGGLERLWRGVVK
jgi:hypothetical protein